MLYIDFKIMHNVSFNIMFLILTFSSMLSIIQLLIIKVKKFGKYADIKFEIELMMEVYIVVFMNLCVHVKDRFCRSVWDH